MGSEDTVTWLVGALVAFVLVIGTIIPTAINLSSTTAVVGTNTGEIWNGTAATVKTVANYPIVTLTTFALSTAKNQYNDSSIAGNSSVNTTQSRLYTLSTPLDTGTVSGKKLNVTIVSTVGAGANYTVYYNGAALGVISASGTDTWSGLTPTSSVNITVTRAGSNLTTISNVSINYNYFAANTNYSVTSATLGQITPTVNGTFYTTYSYGTTTTLSTYGIIVVLLPLLIAVALLYLFLQSSGLF